MHLIHRDNADIQTCRIQPETLRAICIRVEDGTISMSAAKLLMRSLWEQQECE